MINMILATDEGAALGLRSGKLPWGHNPVDMQIFKRLTTSPHLNRVYVGSTTLKTLPKLPGREIVLLTRENSIPDYLKHRDDIVGFCKVEDLVSDDKPAHMCPSPGWIIGGKQIYDKALELGIITGLIVHTNIEGQHNASTYFGLSTRVCKGGFIKKELEAPDNIGIKSVTLYKSIEIDYLTHFNDFIETTIYDCFYKN